MNILSLDGGGIFGIHTAVILDRLETAHPGFTAAIDIAAGTSAGGIIALMLANNLTTKDILEVATNADAFFTTGVVRKGEYDTGFAAKYYDSGRLSVLNQYIGTKTLAELSKLVVIQSFQLNGAPSWNTAVFHNLYYSGCSKLPHTGSMLAVDAGMATSAAPTYFPAWGNYIDGAVTCNNPAMTALALVEERSSNVVDISKLFSIGRTYPGDAVNRNNWDAGLADWLPLIVELLLTGNQSSVDYQCEQFLGKNYFRHSGAIPKALNGGIDAVANIPGLATWAQGLDLSAEIDWINTNW